MNNNKPVDLDEKLLSTFKAATVSKEHGKDIVGLDFSDDGSLLYSADSSTLNVF